MKMKNFHKYYLTKGNRAKFKEADPAFTPPAEVIRAVKAYLSNTEALNAIYKRHETQQGSLPARCFENNFVFFLFSAHPYWWYLAYYSQINKFRYDTENTEFVLTVEQIARDYIYYKDGKELE